MAKAVCPYLLQVTYAPVPLGACQCPSTGENQRGSMRINMGHTEGGPQAHSGKDARLTKLPRPSPSPRDPGKGRGGLGEASC